MTLPRLLSALCPLLLMNTLMAEDAFPSQEKAEFMKSVVLIEGDNGKGTGFLMKEGSNTYLYTAAHVLSGNKNIKFTLSDGTKLSRVAGFQLGIGVDVARFTVKDQVETALERWGRSKPAVKVDDEILSLGNSGGGNVVTSSVGKVNGVGDKSYEVSSQIIQGNSGGPILHAPSKSVVGIATHLIAARDDIWAKDTRFDKVRRFGARLDRSVKWSSMSFASFSTEYQRIEQFDKTTILLFALAQLEPYRDGLKLDARTENGSAALDILEANSDISAVKGLLALNRDVAGRSNALKDHSLMKKYLDYYQKIYRSGTSQTAAFKPSSYSSFHRDDAELSLKYRKEATAALVETIKAFQDLQKDVR